LSPAKFNEGNEEERTSIDEDDQLLKIFKLLGKQPNSELSFIKDENAFDYCEIIMKLEKPMPRLRKKFSELSPDLIKCLKAMITFNPECRVEAKDILKVKYFDDIRC
jgi:hypothetical protein